MTKCDQKYKEKINDKSSTTPLDLNRFVYHLRPMCMTEGMSQEAKLSLG